MVEALLFGLWTNEGKAMSITQDTYATLSQGGSIGRRTTPSITIQRIGRNGKIYVPRGGME